MNVNSKDCILSINETIRTSIKDKHNFLENIFESFEFQKCSFILEESALMFSNNNHKTTSLVINMSPNTISVVPIIEGYVLKKGIYYHSFGYYFLQNWVNTSFMKLNLISQKDFFSKLNSKKFEMSNNLLFLNEIIKFKIGNHSCDDNIKRKLFKNMINVVNWENSSFKIDSKMEYVYEMLFQPELFDLNSVSFIEGIHNSLANIHSHLKNLLLKVDITRIL